ncbi:MAG: bile acid:sodium symporter family protein [Pirellulaceae bacterium]
MLERFLLIWLIAISSVAYGWPNLLANLPEGLTWVGDPFRASKGTPLTVLISVTMFAIGSLLPRKEVKQVVQKWPQVLGGTTVQYAAMPLLALLFGRLLGLSGDYFIGVAMVGCVPGAMASNVLTLNARGNTSYSVSLTTTATLLSPLAVPLVLGLVVSTERSLPISIWLKTSVTLLLAVVLPVVAGFVLSARYLRWERLATRWCPVVANLSILWIIAVVVGVNRENLAQSRLDLLLALLGINVCGYLVGYGSARTMRLPNGMRRALTLEVGMQNAGLGAFLATQLFPDRDAIAIAPAMYTFGCMLTGTLLARIWARRKEEGGRRKEEGGRMKEEG